MKGNMHLVSLQGDLTYHEYVGKDCTLVFMALKDWSFLCIEAKYEQAENPKV